MSLLAYNTPDLSEDLWDKLNVAFPQIEIVPNHTTIDDIMHNAGERKVIAWLERFRAKSIITGKTL